MNPSVGAFSVRTYYPADCFDPFGSTGAGQPLAFDQLMAIYDYFVVHRCRIKVTVASTDPNSGTAQPVGFYVNMSNTTYANAQSLVEQTPLSHCRMVGLTGNPVSLTYTYNPKDFWDTSPLENQSLWGTATGSPNFNSVTALHIVLDNGAGAAASPFLMICDMEYDVEFFGQKNVAPS